MRALLALLAAMTLASLPASAQDAEDDGGGFLERQIESRLSGPGFSVDVRGFEGALSSRATLDALVISDEEGPWLTLRGAVLDWNRSALLRGALEVEELTAEELLVPRMPVGDPTSDVPSPEAQPFSLPDLPVSIQIDKLAIDRVELGQPLFGEKAVVTLDGTASLAGGEGSAELSIERIDDEEGRFSVAGSYANESRVLSLDLDLTEGPGGIVASLIDLPGEPALSLQVSGEGPLSDFTARIGLATDGEPRLSGTVSFLEEGADTARATQRFSVDIGGDLAPLFPPTYRAFFGDEAQLKATGARLPDGALILSELNLGAEALTLTGEARIGPGGVPQRFDLEGEIGAGEGPVLLPVGGQVRVDRAALDLQFDASEGDEWTALVLVEGLDQPGLSIAELRLDGSGRIAQGEDLTVTALLDFAARGISADDGGVQQALGERVTGRAAIDWTSGTPVELTELTLDGASFDLTGQGSVDPDGENIPASLTASLDAQDLQAFSALAGRPLDGALSAELDLTAKLLTGAFDVALDGTGEDLAVGIDAFDPLLGGETTLALRAMRDENGTRLPVFDVENDSIRVEAQAEITSAASNARAEIRIFELSEIDPALSGRADLVAVASGTEEGWQLDIQGSGAEARLTADLSLSEMEDAPSPLARGTATLSARNLGKFSDLAGRDLGGDVAFDIEGQGRLDLSNADVTLTGTTTGLAIGQPDLDRLLRGKTGLTMQIVKDGPRIALPRFRLDNPQITAEAEALYAAGESRIDADVSVQELGEIVPELSGPGRIRLEGQQDGTVWAVELDATGPRISVQADADFRDLLTATTPSVSGEASVAVAGLSRFSRLAGRELGGAVDLQLEGAAAFDASTADITAEGTLTDLRVGQPDLNRLLANETALSLAATKDGDQVTVPRLQLENPQITVSAEGQYGPDDNAVQARAEIPELSVVVPELSGPARVELFAEEAGGTWQVSLDGQGAGAMVDVLADVTGLGGDATPTVSGEASIAAERIGRFSRLAGRDLSGSVEAEAEGSAAIDGSRFNITANAVAQSLGVGIAELDRLLAGRTTLDLRASRDGPDAPIRVRVLDLDAPGLDVTAQGSILGGASDLSFDARLADVAQFAPGISGPVTVSGRAGEAGSGAISLDVTATGPGGITANADGTVARDFSRVNIDADGIVPLGLANSFISPRALSGTANFDIALNGPPALSSLSGQAATSGARLVAPNVPLVLENIDLTANISGNSVRLEGSAAKQAGGGLTIAGPISLAPGYRADLAIDLDDVVFEDPELYRTVVVGGVSITGPLTGGARIGGTLRLEETEIRIPSTGFGSTGPIYDMTHVNEPAAVRATRRRAGLLGDAGREVGDGGGRGPAYPLDITILAENRIFIRGRGLDAELGGRLSLTGTTNNVIPAGQFELIRGRLDLLGKRLDLTEGRISLRGDFVPFIRLVARTDAGDVTVLIVIEGEVSDPEIGFQSQPELPEDEVLARLLFGRSIDEISALQAAQLASAVATLAGRGGEGIIGNLRRNFGLDDLDVTTDEEGNVGVRAGKYISDNVYTGVTVDSEGEAEINLNLDVTPNLTVRGGASNEGDTSVGIFFEKDY